MQEEESIFGPEFDEMILPRRRSLLPWWVKVFTWIFLVLSGMSLVVFPLSFFGFTSELSLYGLETDRPLSLLGFALTTVFLLKGATAFGLWAEKDWAIHVGLADAILGIAICVFMMAVYPFIGDDRDFNLRTELVGLVPFLSWLMKVKPAWERKR
jgi:hypothetical protein